MLAVKTPSVFVFDMGRVLLNFDPMLCIAPYLSDPADQATIAEVAFASPEWKMLDAGTITDSEALDCWLSRLPQRLHPAMTDIFATWHRYMPEIPQMSALVRDLHSAGHPIYLLSNVSLRFEQLKKYFPTFRYLSGYVTSAAEQAVKPDAAIYQILLSRYGLTAEDCLFVDDLPANVEGARAVGMQGYVFDGDTDRLRATLIDMGVSLPPRIIPPKVGLVLEGGAQRGVFTAGVLDRLMEAGLYFPYVVAVSAGACNAYSYLSEQKGRTVRCMLPSKETKYFGMGELLRTGSLLNLHKVFFDYPKIHPFDFDTFFAEADRLEIVATSVETGKPRYFKLKKCRYRLARVGMASCAMPLFAAPVKIAGHSYLDGGVADSIPAARAMEMGCEKTVIILTRIAGTAPTVSDKLKGLSRRYYRKHPAFADVFCRREEIYREQLALVDRLEQEGKAFVIRPTVPTVSRLEQDEERLTDFYRHGYDSMEARIDELMAFLGIPAAPAGEAEEQIPQAQ